MADLIATIAMIVIAIIILAVLIFIFKNAVKLFINAVCGVVILFLYRWLVPGIITFLPPLGDLSIPQVLVCAIGGIPGALIVVILAFFGITI